MIESIKVNKIFKWLNSKDPKIRYIKLAVLLSLMFLTYIWNVVGWIALGVCAIFMLCEFSADSIIWIILMSIFVPHVSVLIVHILMCEFIAILLTQLVFDILKNKINYKNWRFITLASLYFILCLLLLLPLSQTYNFAEQAKRLLLFTTVVLGVFYIKQINIKQLLIMFSISVATLSVLFLVVIAIEGNAYISYNANYSNGIVRRFSSFCNDPNFTGAILICAISSWFVAYRKKSINKYIYFIGLGVLGYFSLATISKATYLTIAIFAIYVVVENIVISIKTKQPKQLLELLWYVGILAIVCAIGWKYLDAMYQRIFNPGSGWWSEGKADTSISNLTTGRTDLWIDYIKHIFGSWQILLFGAGAGSNYISMGAAHSMPLDYLYRYGALICLVLVAIFIISALPYLKKVKPFNFVPLVMITMIFCSIGSISAKYIYMFSIMFLALTYNGVEYQQLTDLNIDKQNIDAIDERIQV